MTKNCCTPSRPTTAPQTLRPDQDVCAEVDVSADSVEIPGGAALVGTGTPQIADDGEGPCARSKLRHSGWVRRALQMHVLHVSLTRQAIKQRPRRLDGRTFSGPI